MWCWNESKTASKIGLAVRIQNSVRILYMLGKIDRLERA